MEVGDDSPFEIMAIQKPRALAASDGVRNALAEQMAGIL